MSQISIIIIFSLMGLVLVIGVVWYVKNRGLSTSGKHKSSKVKCHVKACELYFPKDTNEKFCEFHRKIQKLHIKYSKENDSRVKKTSLYMGLNGKQFSSNIEKIIKNIK